MDEPSLSERERQILEEIERNLAAEDPDFVRNVREVRTSKDASTVLKVGILGLLMGFALLIGGYTVHTAIGIVGFLVMLAGAVAIGTAARQLGEGGRAPGSSLRDVWKRAEGRMQQRRRKDG